MKPNWKDESHHPKIKEYKENAYGKQSSKPKFV